MGASDRAALPVLLGGDAGIGTGRVDERDQRKTVPHREVHDAHRLAVALRVRRAEVAVDPVLEVAALLLAHERDRSAVEAADPGDDRAVVGARTVAVELDPVHEQPLDVVERVRPVLVTRELDGAPDVLVARLLREPLELALELLELTREPRAAEEVD